MTARVVGGLAVGPRFVFSWHFKARNRDEGRPAMGAPSKGKTKGKSTYKCQNTFRGEETASVGPQKANVDLEINAHSSVNRTRKPKGRNNFVHLLRQVHHTENRKVAEQVVMTEVLKAHQNLLVKVSLESKQTTTNFKKGSCQKGYSCKDWHVPECTQFKIYRSLQIRRQVCTQIHSSTC